MKKNNLLLFWLFIHSLSTIFAKGLSGKKSWEYLLDNNQTTIHATHHINNIIRNNTLPQSTKETNLLKELGIKISQQKLIAEAPTYLEETLETDNFSIHYTTDPSNNDAISNTDLNNNLIPDYVEKIGETYEYIWFYFRDTLGYTPPPPDGIFGGSNKYDIYIENLPSNYFAITYTTAFTNASESSCGSYIKMRNNYNGTAFSNLSEIDNIKITAAHEFFHAIQFSYNCYERFWLMEATAVWSEDEIYNDINDHYRYMTSWFQNSSKPIDEESTHMYGSFILFQYIDEHLGGPETIRSIWEESRTRANSVNDISFISIDAALSDNGSSFNSALNNMRIANRIMSNHPNAEPYTYKEADYYPVVGPYEIANLAFNNDPLIYEQNSLSLYSSNYIKLNASIPARVFIENKDGPINDLFGAVIFKHQNDNWTIYKGYDFNIDPSINIEWATILVSAQGQIENDWDYKVTISEGYDEDIILENIYPNPTIYKNSKIEIKMLSTSKQSVDVNIYNILGQNIINWNIHINDPGETKILWDRKNNNRNIVSNGVYFIELVSQNKRIVKKITLLKPSD